MGIGEILHQGKGGCTGKCITGLHQTNWKAEDDWKHKGNLSMAVNASGTWPGRSRPDMSLSMAVNAGIPAQGGQHEGSLTPEPYLCTLKVHKWGLDEITSRKERRHWQVQDRSAPVKLEGRDCLISIEVNAEKHWQVQNRTAPVKLEGRHCFLGMEVNAKSTGKCKTGLHQINWRAETVSSALR